MSAHGFAVFETLLKEVNNMAKYTLRPARLRNKK